MGGHAPLSREFVPPKIKGRFMTRIYGAVAVFFIGFRCYYEGGHHFLRKHAWEDPKVVAHLEKVDKKYGSRLALDNMHH
ncbi:hypothetical protein HK105_207120 [Polyrhizophydium stewartii]|uniref:Uncharacterized protein n=1 Tax=Polyrhizophydium stewartii TaxID=2732419 RepID=A0ABR4N1K9_9FUNG|nr:hypothetical protein HK105_006899 [Polyrhizophydium stewartii]